MLGYKALRLRGCSHPVSALYRQVVGSALQGKKLLLNPDTKHLSTPDFSNKLLDLVSPPLAWTVTGR